MAHSVDVDTVLDAATEIVLRDGFESANMRAIAAKARVIEDELLQLFPSPGELFVAMLNREYRGIFTAIIDHVERDPRGGLLSHIYRHTIGAIHERPLARALYLTDPVALNTIMRSSYSFEWLPKMGPRAEFIDMMKDVGMVRHDIDSASLSAVLASVVAGASLSAPHDELDRIVNGLAVILERAADTDVLDTTPGKRAFLRYGTGLTDSHDEDPRAN